MMKKKGILATVVGECDWKESAPGVKRDRKHDTNNKEIET